MAHIHLQDGAFSLSLTLLWWAVALVLLLACLLLLRRHGRLPTREITVAALCTAAAFAFFQIELPLFGGIQRVRFLHHVATWIFVVFVPVHVYLAMRMDLLEETGTISSIVSGGRLVRSDRVYGEGEARD